MLQKFVKAPFFLFSIFFLYLLNVGCSVCSSKKINCNGYNDSLVLQWFPYQSNEKIIFKNPRDSADLLTISQVVKSEPSEITVGGYGNNATCYASYRVTSLEMDSTVPRLQIYSDIDYDNSGNEERRNTQLILFRERFDAVHVVDTGFIISNGSPPYVTTQFYTTLTLNGRTFANVQMIKIDTSSVKLTGISSVYISRNNGVVGYTSYPSNELWVKQ